MDVVWSLFFFFFSGSSFQRELKPLVSPEDSFTPEHVQLYIAEEGEPFGEIPIFESVQLLVLAAPLGWSWCDFLTFVSLFGRFKTYFKPTKM